MKRLFDIVVALIMLAIMAPLLVVVVLAATVDTRRWGIFTQERIGQHGRPFRVYKVCTMRASEEVRTNVTTENDSRITRLGRLLRRTKVDELPQLVNVLIGQMSMVGPRPDVAGFADRLEGDERRLLTVRPGVTGPASVAFRDEARLLATVDDPERYNREVLWPQKVQINIDYVDRMTLLEDIKIIIDTAIPGLRLSHAARLGRSRGCR